MYKVFIRPLFFLIDPEKVHHFVVSAIRFFHFLPFGKSILKKIFTVENKSLERVVFGLKFKNPVGLAAGFDKNAKVYNEFSSLGFSFIEIGTVTPKGQPGNPKKRLFRLPEDKALINRMGFNNLGVEEAVKNLRKRKNDSIVIGGNIGKNTATPNEKAVDDYVACFNGLYNYVDYFVVNVSCPNISNLAKLQDKDSLMEILSAVSRGRALHPMKKPVLLKISPDLNFGQIDEILEIVKITAIDGIIATNTSISRDGLKTSGDILNKIGRGGLSGLPLKERSTEIIRYISQKTNGKLPIIAVGGIFTADDAIEKINAGASLVQLYTGFIYEGPMIVKRICKRFF
ncbi:MAG TPA: quinone-dependent dihydroorotate dehydrogenase [Bacteroidales bacterium]|nr:quinone-dependent dihydroorotate dehydrogenase [Bacteroidales bacterium]